MTAQSAALIALVAFIACIVLLIIGQAIGAAVALRSSRGSVAAGMFILASILAGLTAAPFALISAYLAIFVES